MTRRCRNRHCRVKLDLLSKINGGGLCTACHRERTATWSPHVRYQARSWIRIGRQ